MKIKILFGLLVYFLFQVHGFSQNKYPIQTMFKGDSVVILTSKQSESINVLIDWQQNEINIKDLKLIERDKKVSALESKIKLYKKDLEAEISKRYQVQLDTRNHIGVLNDQVWKQKKEIEILKEEKEQLRQELKYTFIERKRQNKAIIVGVAIFASFFTILCAQ